MDLDNVSFACPGSVTLDLRLSDAEDLLSRKLKVPARASLTDLCFMVLPLFNFFGAHLHNFSYYDNDKYTQVSNYQLEHNKQEFEEDFYLKVPTYTKTEDKTQLGEIFSEHKSIRLEYDYGDGWVIKISCTKYDQDDALDEPQLVDGKGDGPVEDSGGVDGWLSQRPFLLGDYSEAQEKQFVKDYDMSVEELLEWADMQGYEPFNLEEQRENLQYWREGKKTDEDMWNVKLESFLDK